MTHFEERTEKNDRLIYEGTPTHSRSAPYCAMAIIVDRGGKRELTRLSDLTDDEYTNALNDIAPPPTKVIPVRIRSEIVEREDTTIDVTVPEGATDEQIKELAIARLNEISEGETSILWDNEEISDGLGWFVEAIDGRELPDTEGYWAESVLAVKNDEFIQQIARMTPYGEEDDDSVGAGPSGADAIDTLNALIRKAREITGETQ